MVAFLIPTVAVDVRANNTATVFGTVNMSKEYQMRVISYSIDAAGKILETVTFLSEPHTASQLWLEDKNGARTYAFTPALQTFATQVILEFQHSADGGKTWLPNRVNEQEFVEHPDDAAAGDTIITIIVTKDGASPAFANGQMSVVQMPLAQS